MKNSNERVVDTEYEEAAAAQDKNSEEIKTMQ